MNDHPDPARRVSFAACFYVAFVALAVAPGSASAQRVPTPNRIGESRFADQMREASQNGELDGTAVSRHVHRTGSGDPLIWYGSSYGYSSNPYCECYGYDGYDPYRYGIDGRIVRGGQASLTYSTALKMSQQSGSSRPAPSPAVEPLTDLERARLALELGENAESIRRYRAYLTDERAAGGDDFAAAAELAVALLSAGRRDDAVAMIRLAYSSDPGLAVAAVSQRLDFPAARWRELVVEAVRHANRRGSPASWLAVGVLMQAEGRDDVALRMVERARDLGLSEAIVTPMAAALR